jgi:hypothetical protein
MNDSRQIVITRTNGGQSYVVRRKRVRVPLVNLINYEPATQGAPSAIHGLTNSGSMVGSGFFDFLLTPTLSR